MYRVFSLHMFLRWPVCKWVKKCFVRHHCLRFPTKESFDNYLMRQVLSYQITVFQSRVSLEISWSDITQNVEEVGRNLISMNFIVGFSYGASITTASILCCALTIFQTNNILDGLEWKNQNTQVGHGFVCLFGFLKGWGVSGRIYRMICKLKLVTFVL